MTAGAASTLHLKSIVYGKGLVDVEACLRKFSGIDWIIQLEAVSACLRALIPQVYASPLCTEVDNHAKSVVTLETAKSLAVLCFKLTLSHHDPYLLTMRTTMHDRR